MEVSFSEKLLAHIKWLAKLQRISEEQVVRDLIQADWEAWEYDRALGNGTRGR